LLVLVGLLLSHYENKVEVLILLFFSAGYDQGSRYCGFGHLLHKYIPVILLPIEVTDSLFGLSVSNANVDSAGREHSVHFVQHELSVGARAVSAEDGVESSLVNDCVEGAVLELKTFAVHLLVFQLGVLVLVQVLHLSVHGVGNVNAGNVLVTIFKHLFSQFGVAGSHIQNLELRLQVLGDDILDSGVPLVPVELFLILLISVFPVVGLSVLSH